MLYWSIGKIIVEKEDKRSWGTSVIERLAKDMQNAFPGMAGFSKTNIFRMKAFFLAYPKIPTAVGKLENLPIFKIPWGHNAVLLERVKDPRERLWYAQKTIEYGWSRSMLRSLRLLASFPSALLREHLQVLFCNLLHSLACCCLVGHTRQQDYLSTIVKSYASLRARE